MSNLPPRIKELVRSHEERAAAVGRVQDNLKALRGTSTSEDGAVAVTVAPSGAVLDLQLGPRAMLRTHLQLQDEIVARIREATADAAERMREEVGPVLGDQLREFQAGLDSHTVPVIRAGAEFDPGGLTR